jgi:hypothetical protein
MCKASTEELLCLQVDYAQLLQRLYGYTPELPKHILDATKGIQGDARRLEAALWKMVTGMQQTQVQQQHECCVQQSHF